MLTQRHTSIRKHIAMCKDTHESGPRQGTASDGPELMLIPSWHGNTDREPNANLKADCSISFAVFMYPFSAMQCVKFEAD
jgi:hypothetical protein